VTDDPAAPTEESLLAYLRAHPGMARPVHRAVVLYARRGRPFAWREVGEWPRTLDRLVVDGVLGWVDRLGYAVADPQAALRAVARYEAEVRRAQAEPAASAAEVAPPPGAPPDLFGDIVGFDGPKRQILLALAARDPVHVLLTGPPASAKSLFLEGLARLPGAVYRFGDGITRSGLRRYLLEEKVPYLVIDEIEKFKEDEDTALLEFMERQRVSMLVTGVNRDEAVNIRVFAAANKPDRMREELLSRFHKIMLPAYTPEEFQRVAYRYLVKRGTSDPLARLIAIEVSGRTRDLRDARRIGSMARTEADARFLIDQLGKEARL